jgi:cytochrome b involved in lipid metabolism
MSGMLSGKEVALHKSRESCWIIVHGTHVQFLWPSTMVIWFIATGHVYDVTEFLDGTSNQLYFVKKTDQSF